MKKLLAIFLFATLTSAPAWADTQTVTLSVPGMTCAACPITVRKALTRVDGVSSAKVSLERREATVTFDDAKTSVRTLLDATNNAGYPSTVAKSASQ